MSKDNRAIKNETDADSNDKVLQWVTFQLDDETYGINVMQVQEVLRQRNSASARSAELCTGYHQPAW